MRRLPAVAWVWVLAVLPASSPAKVPDVTLTQSTLAEGKPLTKDWRYHPGDDPAWAVPGFDDSAWEVVDSKLAAGALLESGWSGLGWFRMAVAIDPSLGDADIAFEIDQEGAAEVYLDGRLVAVAGTVGTSVETEQAYWFPDPPRILDLEAGRVHSLAVRYSNHAGHDKLQGRGFRLTVRRLRDALDYRDWRILVKTKEAMFLTGIAAAFAVLHLMLFLFFPRARANLYFAIFTASIAGLYWFDQRAHFQHDPAKITFWFKCVITCGIAIPVAAIGMALLAFGRRISAHVYVLATFGAGLAAWYWITPGWPSFPPFLVFGTVAMLETLRTLGVAIFQRQGRAWVIGLGFLFLVVVMLSPYVGLPVDGRVAVSVGLVGLLISISIHLGMTVAHTQLDLGRKTEELEAARRLQLSLLPAERPEHPHAEVDFAMWTATEVGGDYYDYRLGDGTLTLAIGDATGHGLDSGHLVVAAKGIFQAADADAGLSEVMNRIARGIRSLGLPRMNMAMALARLNGRTLRLASAGMPPALVYRAAGGSVEEILLPGPPLGTLAGFRYEAKDVALQPGDAVLLTSDGLPELTSPQGEVLGYERVRALYAEVAAEPPAQVLEHLAKAEREFSGGRAREDDLTLVALRAK